MAKIHAAHTSRSTTARPHEATFRFYAELNDFLAPDLRQRAFIHRFDGHPAVKDTIEALGVPHTEVDLVLVDGRSVGFAHPLRDGDRVAVYPMFEAIDITPLLEVRPRPLREPRFLLDVHLGRLATYLRLLGVDADYANDRDDDELAASSRREGRTLLTRDHGLLKRSAVTHGYFVREREPRRQVVEVMRRFDLARLVRPFTRCLRCNTTLEAAARADVLERLPPRTAARHDDFRECPTCRRVYWRGSHYERMRGLIDHLLGEATGGDRAGAR